MCTFLLPNKSSIYSTKVLQVLYNLDFQNISIILKLLVLKNISEGKPGKCIACNKRQKYVIVKGEVLFLWKVKPPLGAHEQFIPQSRSVLSLEIRKEDGIRTLEEEKANSK